MKGENLWEFQKNVILSEKVTYFWNNCIIKISETTPRDTSAVWAGTQKRSFPRSFKKVPANLVTTFFSMIGFTRHRPTYVFLIIPLYILYWRIEMESMESIHSYNTPAVYIPIED